MFLPAVIWAIVIFVLSSIPGTSFPEVDVPSADKLVHTAVYAVLGFFIALSLVAMRPWRRTGTLVVTAAIIGTLYGVTDEVHQSFVPNRSPDARDVVADLVGSTVGAALLGALHKRRSRRLQTTPEPSRGIP